MMVGPRELESLTSCVSSRRSNQLSYGPQNYTSFLIYHLAFQRPQNIWNFPAALWYKLKN